MRKVILLEHVSLDGFMAGPNGEMGWIRFDEELSDYVGKLTDNCDTAVYGRITFQMMENYWPTAAQNPEATKHDIEHANWVNKAVKIVFSKSLEKSDWSNTKILRNNVAEEITKLKSETGKNIFLVGSASIAHQLMHRDLIDEYWINVNPVILGDGLFLFKNANKSNLQLIKTKAFANGVVALQYKFQREK